MTNYEKIKEMTVEEMAAVFEMRELYAVATSGIHDSRQKPAIEWLKQEVKE